MKLLCLLFILLSSLISLAQTTNPSVTKSARDESQYPKLEDIKVDVDNEGRFKTMAGTPKQISTLKLSDLPNSSDDPLAIESTAKCLTFEALVLENEKRGGALGKMMPAEVLTGVQPAAATCLFRNAVWLPENRLGFLLADVGAMVDAQAEMDRRQYDQLVEKYNALIEKHNTLLAFTRELASQLATARWDLAHQQQINNTLTTYQLMPKYTPPPPTVNIQITDCTRTPALCVH